MIRIICLLCIFFSLNLSAATPAEKGDEAYSRENYSEAVSLYEEAIKKDGVSTDLYYNLGNAYYRIGDISNAILSYERSLRLDPANDDARANLEFVNARIVDKKGETGSFIYNTVVSIANFTSSNGWAWIALTFFILTILGIIVYRFTDAIWLRKLGFFGGAILLLLSIVSILLSFKAKSISADTSDAIITSETTILSTVPRQPVNREEEAMLLHEGTKVRILRSMSHNADSASQTWHEVEVDNRHRAWINDSDIEKIMH